MLGGRGARLVCYWHRVLLVPVCVQRVRERVATVYSSFIGCMGGGYRWIRVFGVRAAQGHRSTVHVRTAKRYVTVRTIRMWSETKVGSGGLGGVVTWCGSSSRRCRFCIDELIAAAHGTQQTTVITALARVGSSSNGVACRSETDSRLSLVDPT